MPVSPYITHLRRSIGDDLILLPSVTVLPRDHSGKILLVRQSDTRTWATIGGMIEVDEAPADAAVRETREEAGIEIELVSIVAALGGPQFRLTYPNGHRTAYVSIVYDARVASGEPAPDHNETVEVAWFHPGELAECELGTFARSTFTTLGYLDTER